jgi:hypothetical protein
MTSLPAEVPTLSLSKGRNPYTNEDDEGNLKWSAYEVCPDYMDPSLRFGISEEA